MATFRVHQVRSGEGWILTEPSNLGAEALAAQMPDLLRGPLLVASEDFETWTPPGGEQLEAHLYAFMGEDARAILANWKRWGGRRAIFAFLPSLPDADARRRWIPHALRPWDPERLKATCYGQLGKEWAQRGFWFATERDRARFVELAVSRLLADAGVRLPNGDVTIVLEMPTDSTFDAQFKAAGSGTGLTLSRDFASQQVAREWTIVKGEWQATERKTSRAAKGSLKDRLTQGLATAGILVLSIPVFVMVVIVALVAKMTGSATSVSTSAKATSR